MKNRKFRELTLEQGLTEIRRMELGTLIEFSLVHQVNGFAYVTDGSYTINDYVTKFNYVVEVLNQREQTYNPLIRKPQLGIIVNLLGYPWDVPVLSDSLGEKFTQMAFLSAFEEFDRLEVLYLNGATLPEGDQTLGTLVKGLINGYYLGPQLPIVQNAIMEYVQEMNRREMLYLGQKRSSN